MYVKTGMGAYRPRRRGMGGCSAVTGADGQPRVVCDTPINTDVVTTSGQNITTDASGNVILVSTPSLIPGIPNWAVGAGAGMLFLMMFAKAGR